MDSFTRKINNKWLFSLFTLSKLPSLWFWGIRVDSFSPLGCKIALKYSWFTKNPFQSIYFSALSGAAELSTGLLVQRLALAKGNVSMLVVKAECYFTKKATGNIVFFCQQGEEVETAFQSLVNSGDTTQLVLQSIGKNEAGDEVARFSFTWALKKK
ncbi:MAG: DUF4442 domain-containing protein [Saprospiraceae bacterium]|nr:DUF4442 domain-containing protein [Saprospiraceae bacterium]